MPHHPDVHVTYPGVRAQTAGIAAHRRKRAQVVVRRAGIPVTSPLQTFFDLAHVLDLVDLVVLGDSLVRRKRFTPQQLRDFVDSRGGPHIRRARRAATLVRRGVDSAMETRVRLLIVFAGLPEPEIDHRVHDEDGNLLRRYDLSYLSFRLIIEYDGRQHADSEEQWLTDIRPGRAARRRADPAPGHRVSGRLQHPGADAGPDHARHARPGYAGSALAKRVAPPLPRSTRGRAEASLTEPANSARAQLPVAKRRNQHANPPGRNCRGRSAGNQHANSARAQLTPRRRATRAEGEAGDGGARWPRMRGGYVTAYAKRTTGDALSVRSRRTEAEPEPITLRMGNRTRMPRVGRGVLVHSGHG